MAAAAPPRLSAPAAPCAAAGRRAGLPAAACLFPRPPACRHRRTVSDPAAPGETPPLRGRREKVPGGARRDEGRSNRRRGAALAWRAGAAGRGILRRCGGSGVLRNPRLPPPARGATRAPPPAPRGSSVGPVGCWRTRPPAAAPGGVTAYRQKSGSGSGVCRCCLRRGAGGRGGGGESSFSGEAAVGGLCPAPLRPFLQPAAARARESGCFSR